MAGIFQKGGKGVPLTPAQLQLQQAALQNAQHFSNVWLPLQSFFAQQVNQQAPGLKEMGRGTAAASARAAGDAALGTGLAADSGAGAAAGSGRYLRDLGAGFNAAAAGAGAGLAAADAAGDQHYVNGLQQILGVGQADQKFAMGGLQQAANAQAQEAGATAQANQAQAQGAGQTLGSAAGLLVAAL
jgi:hypothetical protein